MQAIVLRRVPAGTNVGADLSHWTRLQITQASYAATEADVSPIGPLVQAAEGTK